MGNLGEANHKNIMKSLERFFSTKKSKRIFIFGDFNLSCVNWPIDENNPIINPVEKLFVDSFFELGLSQCILQPTHDKGRTLDLLLTNYPGLINNLNVSGW